MSPSSDKVAGVIVKVDGNDLPPEFVDNLGLVRVDDSIDLPSSAEIRVNDPQLKNIDSTTFDIGKKLVVQFQAPDESQAFKTVFEGEITGMEPAFQGGGAEIVVRAFDFGHRLMRSRKSRTYQNMSDADIARKVIGDNTGVAAGTVDSGGPVFEHVYQHNETDWEFLRTRARRLDFELSSEGNKIHFRKIPSGSPITLKWGETLTQFRAQLTGVQQLDEVEVRGWGPKRKEAIVGSAMAAKTASKIGVKRSKLAQGAGWGAAKAFVGDRLVTSVQEARAIAESTLNAVANSYLRATGTAQGNPDLKAGVEVKIEGVGTRYGGTYRLSEVVHKYSGGKGYTTDFRNSAGAHSLVSLMTPAQPRDWSRSVVIGVVTDNNDPQSLGRVRVKYPSLSQDGQELEGWWARVTAPSAGKDRGLLMMPIVGDEVLVAFENGDARSPYVIGSVWGGQSKPNDLVQKDGSYVLQSDKQIIMKAKDPITVKGDKELKIETTGAISQKSSNKVGLEASQDFAIKGMKVTIDASSSVEISANASVTIKAQGSITVQATGMLSLKGSQIMLG